MSWGAFNICSEDHAVGHNVEVATGAKYAVRYPYKFDSKGIRFWATPKGSALDIGRCGRSWEFKTWLYKRNESPTPTVTYEKPPYAPNPAIHLSTLAGYDVSEDGPYVATFYNQCDRLYIAQNLEHSSNAICGSNSKELILQPAKVSASNVLAKPSYYFHRPFMAPSMPQDYVVDPINWPNLKTKRGLKHWVNNGWAYKKANRYLNSRNKHEFDWEEDADPEWGNDAIWDVSPNPARRLDRNLLYLVEKRYSHGSSHTCPPGTNPRECDDRKLTGYVSHYWCKRAPAPQQWNPEALLKSWCVDDGYPYINTGYTGWKNGWAPFSISCGWGGAFARTRTLEYHTGDSSEPYYAKTDKYDEATSASAKKTGYAALKEFIPEHTAFDLIVYLEVVYYAIFERTSRNLVTKGYWNTICHSIIHQIAPLPPKPI